MRIRSKNTLISEFLEEQFGIVFFVSLPNLSCWYKQITAFVHILAQMPAEHAGGGYMFNLAEVTVYPYRYNPVTKRLRRLVNGTVYLTFIGVSNLGIPK